MGPRAVGTHFVHEGQPMSKLSIITAFMIYWLPSSKSDSLFFIEPETFFYLGNWTSTYCGGRSFIFLFPPEHMSISDGSNSRKGLWRGLCSLAWLEKYILRYELWNRVASTVLLGAARDIFDEMRQCKHIKRLWMISFPLVHYSMVVTRLGLWRFLYHSWHKLRLYKKIKCCKIIFWYL